MQTRNETPDLHVVLVAPEIHWNTGNIGRTCLAAGARLHLVEPLGFSLEAREIRRAGLDYWPHVRPCLWPDWDTFELHLPELGEASFFSAEAPRSFWSASYVHPAPAVLIFGCETRGLPRAVRDRFSRYLVSIPQYHDRIRSLNLSSSVGIALYEVLRQRRQA